MSTETERDERLRGAQDLAKVLRIEVDEGHVHDLVRRHFLVLDAEVARLDAVVTAVRELHKPMAWDKRFCDHCEPLVPDPRHVFYPCPTVRALDGGAA